MGWDPGGTPAALAGWTSGLLTWPKSYTPTMFGWFSLARARASRVKRSAKPGSLPVRGGRIFKATRRSSPDWRALYTAPMPPLPISSRTSSWGKSLAMASTVGGTKLPSLPPSVPGAVPKPAFIRHSGQIPCGASAASGFLQLEHIRIVSINVFLPVSEGMAGGRLH
jgi:hypothetical protein